MTELRYNPLLQDWTMVASGRQGRPNLPKDDCPFCPGSGKVPDHYDVYVYDNDFPALSGNPPQSDVLSTPLYKTAPAYGKCEVILYSEDHVATLSTMTVTHIRKIVDVWTDRFVTLEKDPRHHYVLIFENRGREVGVTMPHPHGQIYAYPYVPMKIATELNATKAHYHEHGECLICQMNQEEKRFSQRVVVETEHFISYIPFFSDYPYGAFIVSKAHKTALPDLTLDERDDLALIVKRLTAGMDELFSREFPYMMVLHQRPVDGSDVESYYHFHIEFYPPLRDESKMKYLASSETGAWAPCNPMAVEETAAFLRAAVDRATTAEGEIR
ncbi:MAG: galactose-1-phosphate uridylyltransferase [Acidibacillus sp.]|uniref:Galactose-1-phosphate uridylyltransferase n=1 Tax=Sulfoacidibacillus ferrooxidans TaxID=2005001 RepID=A0A9X1V8Q1_9BACL|nr:galactose-1-phosphate uridylyltransferase [Sulfoacidibacillus ferrooxidans]MCI0182068.1 Galactose-1-phosphate uridylyltransferase [Sulfoacidibacillus ferrooxidans]MCY0892443.1 galactose-1-phosphate uridylyltransferase [Acidibacillus sp.]